MKQNLKRYCRIMVVGTIFQLLSIVTSYGQNNADKINELVSRYAEYEQFNGSVLVAEQGKVIYKKGFGLANMEWDIPNQPDTKHRLGSVTKQFTALLILQLIEEGKINLDATISTYLPEYPKNTGEKITVHHLLTHTSGIPNYTSFPDFFKKQSRDPYTPVEFIPKFANLPLDFTPGEKFSYSNSGYFLLGAIIEKTTGKSYEQVIQERIFTPLKMVNSGYDHHSTILKNRATGYKKKGNLYKNSEYLDMSIPYAAGSLYSTVEDLYLWDQGLYNNQLLSPEMTKLLFKPEIPAWGGSYAYGWQIMQLPLDENGTTIAGHSGGINGFSSFVARIPSDKHFIVLLNNTGGAALMEMTIAIANILYEKPYNFPKKSLAFTLYKNINHKGLDAALTQFEKDKNLENYALNENEMNGVGYQFIEEGKMTEAIEVFKLNVEAFPKSFNAYDSLGEAYMIQGNKPLALKNYKKSVAINPENKGGIIAIEKLSP